MKAYRYNDLVYIPIYKNAATTYTILFESMNWQPMLSEHIDWDSHTVFAHITDPYQRHLKGTTQFLFQYDLESLVHDQRFNRLLAAGFFDQHTYPLSVMFGDRMNKINWLPIDSERMDGNTVTSKFLKQHGIDVAPAQIPQLNPSGPNKKNLLKQIQKIAEELDYKNDGLFFLLDNDNIVYKQSINNLYLYN